MSEQAIKIERDEIRLMLVSLCGYAPPELDRALANLPCQIINVLDIEHGFSIFEDGVVPELMLVALDRDVSMEEVGRIEALVCAANAIYCPVILSAPLEALDRLSGEVWAGCDAVLVDPSEVDYAAAVALATGAKQPVLSDVARDVDAARLQRLADEVGRIARTLATLSAAAPLPTSAVADVHPMFIGEPVHHEVGVSAAEVRALIRMRRMRERFFDKELLADPAWDMLLDLMAARLERVQVAVSSLCIAACVPPTTALRWIKNMTDAGLFERVSDPDDGRRIFIRLSDASAAAMTRFFTAMRVAGEVGI